MCNLFFLTRGSRCVGKTWGVDSARHLRIEDECLNLNHFCFVFSLTPSDPPWFGVTGFMAGRFWAEIPHEKCGDFPGGKIMELITGGYLI